MPPGVIPDLLQTLFRELPATTRELYALHAREPACAGCHRLLDSVGFSFEDFDGAARLRTLENGAPIDTRGELVNSDVDGSLASHAQLAERLAQSEWVRECVARQAFRFYFGDVEADRGVPAVQAARAALANGTFRDMVMALFSQPSTFSRVRR